jgi:hypothetical protein
LELLAREKDDKQSMLEETLQSSKDEYAALLSVHKALENEKNILERDYAVLYTRYEDATSAHNEKIKLLDEAKETLKQQFNQLANEIFESKTKHFEEGSQERLNRDCVNSMNRLPRMPKTLPMRLRVKTRLRAIGVRSFWNVFWKSQVCVREWSMRHKAALKAKGAILFDLMSLSIFRRTKILLLILKSPWWRMNVL